MQAPLPAALGEHGDVVAVPVGRLDGVLERVVRDAVGPPAAAPFPLERPVNRVARVGLSRRE